MKLDGSRAQLYYGIANPEVGPDSCGIEMAQYIFSFAPDEKRERERKKSTGTFILALWTSV